jgi:hypothetical protein
MSAPQVTYKGKPGSVNHLTLDYRNLVLKSGLPITAGVAIHIYSYNGTTPVLQKTFNVVASKPSGSFSDFSVALGDSPCLGVEVVSPTNVPVFGFVTLKAASDPDYPDETTTTTTTTTTPGTQTTTTPGTQTTTTPGTPGTQTTTTPGTHTTTTTPGQPYSRSITFEVLDTLSGDSVVDAIVTLTGKTTITIGPFSAPSAHDIPVDTYATDTTAEGYGHVRKTFSVTKSSTPNFSVALSSTGIVTSNPVTTTTTTAAKNSKTMTFIAEDSVSGETPNGIALMLSGKLTKTIYPGDMELEYGSYSVKATAPGYASTFKVFSVTATSANSVFIVMNISE